MGTITVVSAGFSPPVGAPVTAPGGGSSDADALGSKFGCACQPIVDVSSRTVLAHEVLVRGPQGESA